MVYSVYYNVRGDIISQIILNSIFLLKSLEILVFFNEFAVEETFITNQPTIPIQQNSLNWTWKDGLELSFSSNEIIVNSLKLKHEV